jgi:hypothetical protein
LFYKHYFNYSNTIYSILLIAAFFPPGKPGRPIFNFQKFQNFAKFSGKRNREDPNLPNSGAGREYHQELKNEAAQKFKKLPTFRKPESTPRARGSQRAWPPPKKA